MVFYTVLLYKKKIITPYEYVVNNNNERERGREKERESMLLRTFFKITIQLLPPKKSPQKFFQEIL